MREFESSHSSQPVRRLKILPSAIPEMAANGGLLRIGGWSLDSGFGRFRLGLADSLRRIFEIFPFSGDSDRRSGSIRRRNLSACTTLVEYCDAGRISCARGRHQSARHNRWMGGGPTRQRNRPEFSRHLYQRSQRKRRSLASKGPPASLKKPFAPAQLFTAVANLLNSGTPTPECLRRARP
jgi:hypothetical protein